MIKLEGSTVQLLNNRDKVLLEIEYFMDEFVWIVKTQKPIVIEREGNETFYDELNEIMNCDYEFQSNNPSKKTPNRLVWLSDQYCDLEDEESVRRVNRLIIDRLDNKFIISVENPFLERIKRKRDLHVVAFSPLSNGYYAKNKQTGTTLQDDFAMMYHKILNEKIRRLK